MLALPRKLLFAVEAVVDIARQPGGDPVPSRDITRRQGIPPRYLEQVLQHLVRAGILVGVRGPRGGYRLARERRRITLGEITRVIAAMDRAGDPLEAEGGSELARKVVRPVWAEVRDAFMTRLDTVTVEDLCHRAREAGIGAKETSPLDFTI